MDNNSNIEIYSITEILNVRNASSFDQHVFQPFDYTEMNLKDKKVKGYIRHSFLPLGFDIYLKHHGEAKSVRTP